MTRAGDEDRVLRYEAIQQLIAEPHEKMIVLILKEKRWKQHFADSPEPIQLTSAGKDGFVVAKY